MALHLLADYGSSDSEDDRGPPPATSKPAPGLVSPQKNAPSLPPPAPTSFPDLPKPKKTKLSLNSLVEPIYQLKDDDLKESASAPAPSSVVKKVTASKGTSSLFDKLPKPVNSVEGTSKKRGVIDVSGMSSVASASTHNKKQRVEENVSNGSDGGSRDGKGSGSVSGLDYGDKSASLAAYYQSADTEYVGNAPYHDHAGAAYITVDPAAAYAVDPAAAYSFDNTDAYSNAQYYDPAAAYAVSSSTDFSSYAPETSSVVSDSFASAFPKDLPKDLIREMNKFGGSVHQEISSTMIHNANAWRPTHDTSSKKNAKPTFVTKVWDAEAGEMSTTANSSRLAKHKHSLGWLAAQANEIAQDVAEAKGRTRQTKAQTQAKYGW
jgi:hypothetical protein